MAFQLGLLALARSPLHSDHLWPVEGRVLTQTNSRGGFQKITVTILAPRHSPFCFLRVRAFSKDQPSIADNPFATQSCARTGLASAIATRAFASQASACQVRSAAA